jgi:hypothetical protein
VSLLTPLFLAGALALGLAPAGRAHAQAAQATTDVGPHYAGEPISIRVTAVGFEEDPAPRIDVPAPPQGNIELVGVSPSVTQSITIVNGRMGRTRDVTHVFQFRYVAERPGNVLLGPFRIAQGAREAVIPAVRLAVEAIPASDGVRVEVELPEGEVFVGERVPVTISFTLERSLQQGVLDYHLRVPLFDLPAFRFLDEERSAPGRPSAGSNETNVVIETAKGRLELPGRSREFEEGGRRFVTIRVSRTLVPLVAGRHALPPTTLSVEEGVRFRRDFFGGRRATEVRRWRAEAPGRLLAVGSIPGQEQPSSFGGGIGRGFTLEVAADRTVVQVGDPITLTLVLHGEGLETAALPPLDAEGLLPPDLFRAPQDSPAGELRDDAKRFTAVVRVLRDDVGEIPALAYSWFDPDSRKYETTHSRPIALSVRPAEVIGAREVEVATAAEADGAGTRAEAARAANTEDAAPSRALSLTGADLAIERDPERVLGGAAVFGGRWLPPTLYGASCVVVGLALLDRRRRDADPRVGRRRRVLAEELARVRSAGALPPDAGATAIAGALRRMLQEVPSAASAEIEAVLGECDARRYAPAGQQQPLSPELLARATRLAEGIAP